MNLSLELTWIIVDSWLIVWLVKFYELNFKFRESSKNNDTEKK